MNTKQVTALVLLPVALGILGFSAFAAFDKTGSTPAAGDTTEPGQASSSTSSVKGEPQRPPTAPLTGFVQTDDSLRNRPAVIVKIDNSEAARPQYGLEKADIVYEEKVEGGTSRFMALFQSQDTGEVGPVRSLRSTDVFAARPLNGAVMGFSGGIGPFKQMLPSSKLTDASADAKPQVYTRKKGRPFLNSLSTSTSKLREFAPKSLGAPTALFEYSDPGAPFDAAGANNVTSISGSLGQSSQFDWTWDASSGLWKRGANGKAHNLVSGQIGVANVVVQFVPYRPTPYKDQANNPVDEASLEGTGDSWVLSDGKLVAGRWVAPSLNTPTQFNDAAGQPVKLKPGNTWVVLVPAGNQVQIHP